MKIVILTIGTRGDVQPFVALGMELQRRGHRITISTSTSFESFVRGFGLDYAPVSADMAALSQSAEGKEMMGGNPAAVMRNMKTVIYPMMERMMEDFWTAAQSADVIIYHPKALGAYDIVEKTDVPAFIAHPVPIIMPTGAFTNPTLPARLRNRWLNKRSYMVNRLMTAAFGKLINRFRIETLGLVKRSMFGDDLRVNGREIPVLYGCSPSVLPFDPEWEGRVCMRGFWFLPDQADSDWKPAESLQQFLSSGPAPIAVTFSSMPLEQPEQIFAVLKQALKSTGNRGVILTGRSGMPTNVEPEGVLFSISEAPHAALFPRTAGIIHHGGAGTTAEALRAGKPMTLIPFSGDQPFWARQMHELGVATKPLNKKEWNADMIADRIREMTEHETMQRRARIVSEQLQQENGTFRTADFIERYIAEFPSH